VQEREKWKANNWGKPSPAFAEDKQSGNCHRDAEGTEGEKRSMTAPRYTAFGVYSATGGMENPLIFEIF
jgi:hypothetical protein